MNDTPKTLLEAVEYFADPDNALHYLAAKRWPDGVVCPHCDEANPMFLKTRRIWKCRKCRKQFSVKVGTTFEDSAIPLGKWLAAVWLISNCKNGVSSYEIARDIGVTQKTAWFMLHRIRLALQDARKGGKLSGEVEADETFIGGKARNMHAKKRREKIHGRGPVDKTIVAGVLERGGKVRTKVVTKRRKKQLQGLIRDNVESGSALFTDELKSYDGLGSDYAHEVINHAETYVRERVHTNGMENFWSLLKRGLHGTYISVEPFHLFRYLDEQAFRYNNRKDLDDEGRFALACSQIAGRRLTWKKLVGEGTIAQPAG
jgi:transposase-like protein